MPWFIELQSSKTYATKANAIKAVEKFYGEHQPNLRYIVYQNDAGRFFPVFLGTEALHAMVHFNFTVVA